MKTVDVVEFCWDMCFISFCSVGVSLLDLCFRANLVCLFDDETCN